MANKGHRHRLVLYTYILNRWWRATLFLGCSLLVLVAALTWLPGLLQQYPFPHTDKMVLFLTGGIAIFVIFFSIALFIFRRLAYVQPFDGYLRLVTPFMQMDISYRRFVRTSCTAMSRLFPLEKYKGQKLDFLRPIAGETAIVLDLNSWPMPRKFLNLFLSGYFFPDKTPRLALLVPDWMRFSTELESFRSAWLDTAIHPETNPKSDLLASFSGKG